MRSTFKSGYSEVNGIKMYYEIYGQGNPLVLIHGGGSTIQSTFGRIIPRLAKNYTVMAMDLQNHGRSGSRNIPETFEQDSDDVATLLNNLRIEKASFFGFSNGGTTAMQIASRHPELVDKLILAAAAFKKDGFVPGLFEGMNQASLDNMPSKLKEAFLQVNPNSTKLQIMFERDRDRMIAFTDIDEGLIKSIPFPTLIIAGDKDVVTHEHTLEMYRLMPNARLAIIPGTHGEYIGEITTLKPDYKESDFILPIIENFLDDTDERQ
jgi:pimeloyl-ACP methyl ester carboxylesterase